MGLRERLRSLDDKADEGLRARGVNLSFQPDRYRVIGTTERWGRWGGPPVLFLRVFSGVAVLISWPVYLVIVALVCVGIVGYVQVIEGPGHDAILPVVIALVLLPPAGLIFAHYGRQVLDNKEGRDPRPGS